MKKVLIIGAGPVGLTTGRLLAEEGYQVDLFERRDHIGGNCFDYHSAAGLLCHKYGPHYFRTNSDELLAWLSQFSDWIPANYHVRAKVQDKFVPLPISLATVEALKGRTFSVEEFEHYLAQERVAIEHPQNAEEQCLATVGRELYEAIFKGYTEKQWGISAKELLPSITARIPLRFNRDIRYPSEKHQVMPAQGYTYLFKNMADHSRLSIKLNQEFCLSDVRAVESAYEFVICSGQLDQFFEYQKGKLPYRSLRFEEKISESEFVQENVQINYPNDFDYTRTVEIKHVTGQQHPLTSVVYEYAQAEGEAFYPILSLESLALCDQYRELARQEERAQCPIYFLGRLAEYRYFNMDHVFLRSIKLVNQLLNKEIVKV